MNTPLPKFIFFGTPDVASKTLEILKSHGYIPSLIITAPDRPVGRHFTMTPPPTKTWAIENNVPYLQPEKIDEVFVSDLKKSAEEAGAELFIVVAYGKILPQSLIDIPKLGTLNIHYSLLPKWRGASPVEASVLHGESETGISIQKMVFKLDAGPVIAEECTAINPDETAKDLRERLIVIGGELLAKTLPDLASGNIEARDQDESQATRCGKIKKEDGLVDPFADNPRELYNKYRAYFGWPGIYFMQDGKRYKITQARFENNEGTGKFIIEKVIPEGKKEISWN